MKLKLIQDGNFSAPFRAVLVVVGVLLIILPAEFMKPSWMARTMVFLGLVVAAFGGFASRAHTLGLKPFDNSYKKARKTYEAKDEEDDLKS